MNPPEKQQEFILLSYLFFSQTKDVKESEKAVEEECEEEHRMMTYMSENTSEKLFFVCKLKIENNQFK